MNQFDSQGESPPQNKKRINGVIGKALDTLQKDYVIVGKNHILAWKAWLVIGLAAGIATGVILVANRSGELEGSRAAEDNDVYSEEYIPSPLKLQVKETDASKKAGDLSLAVLRMAAKIKGESGALRALDIITLSKKLTERKGLLAVVLKEDPFTAFTLLFPPSVIVGLPTEVRGIAEEPITTEGKIEIIHQDDFQNKKSSFRYFLRTTDGKRRRFYPVGGEPALLSGSMIRIKGHRIGEDLIAPVGKDSFEVLSAETPDSIGDQKTLVVLMTFLDSPPPPFTPEEAKKLVFEDQMQAFYKEASYGKVSWSGDVLGWFTAQRNGEVSGVCQWPQIQGSSSPFDDVYKFIKDKVDLHNYGRLVIMANHPCMNGGSGIVGKGDDTWDGQTYHVSISWIGSLQYYWVESGDHPFAWHNLDYILSHELGHNLGAMHGNAWECGVGKILYGSCSHQEYANHFEVMGDGGVSLHFDAFYKDLFGWLPDSTLSITKTGTYTLTPLESSSGMRIAKIKPPFLSAPPYYLEYRRPLGFDASLAFKPPEIAQHGLLVNWIPRFSAGWFPFSRLLDMSPTFPIPVTSEEWMDNYDDWVNPILLQKGYRSDQNAKTAFYDKGRGVVIGPVWSADDTQNKFNVTILPPRCVNNNPYVEFYDYFKADFVSAIPGDVRIFIVALQNLDSPTCAPSRFQTSVIAPTGWEYTIGTLDPILLAPEYWPIYNQVQISVPTTASPGQYTVTLRFTNLDTKMITDKVITYTITQ